MNNTSGAKSVKNESISESTASTSKQAQTNTKKAAIEWQLLTFDAFSALQWYQVTYERERVFVVEQNCPYQDADGLDPFCLHLLGYVKDDENIDRKTNKNNKPITATNAPQLAAYCRIVLPDAPLNSCSNMFENHELASAKQNNGQSMGQTLAIGRVLVVPEYRGQGLATELMKQAMQQAVQYCKVNQPEDSVQLQEIHLSAQVYLTEFYRGLGFVTQGETYLEDGIPHIHMLYAIH